VGEAPVSTSWLTGQAEGVASGVRGMLEMTRVSSRRGADSLGGWACCVELADCDCWEKKGIRSQDDQEELE